LTGLSVFDKESIVGRFTPVPIGASSFKKEADAARLARAQKRAENSLSKFRERCLTAGIPAGTIQGTGDPADCILTNAQRCDVVILGRETNFRFQTEDHSDAVVAQILRRSPRPVVAVPKQICGGKDIMVAYGGGREVARTLQTFELLGLAGGEKIHIVTVRRTDKEDDGASGLAAEFLQSRGAKCEVHLLQSNLDPAQLLLDQVQIIRPRLLVMGAQGYHPVRDLFATSVTRAVLSACSIPVLMGA
jgi:nucleotide-binding universal stress UspA family protein